MRFGITPLEGKNITRVFDKKKGLKSFLNFHVSDIILEAIERGYQHCEITLDLFQVLPVQVNNEEIVRLKSLKKQHDITYSAHFPIWSIELASPNKIIREASVRSSIEAFNVFKQLEPEIDVFVIHPTGALIAELMNVKIKPKYRRFILDLIVTYSTNSIKSIIRKTMVKRSKIAIENIEFPFDRTLDIIKSLKGVKLCIDTAHFLGGFSGNHDIVDIAKNYLDITAEIHLQDYSPSSGADHAALGTSNKFPLEFLKLINEKNFDGPIVFELTFAQAFKSVEFIKKNIPLLRVPDIKRN